MADQRRRVISGQGHPPITRKNAPANATGLNGGVEHSQQPGYSSTAYGRSSRPQSRQGSTATASSSTLAAHPASYHHSAKTAAPPLRSASSTPVSRASSNASSYDEHLRSRARTPVKSKGNANGGFGGGAHAFAQSGHGENTTLRPTAVHASDTRTVSSSSASSSGIPASGPALAPKSPTKERIRMAGIRSAGVGGSHFKQKGDEESNIQVSVRIRGLAPGDAPLLHPILATDGPHCSSIRVGGDHASSSSLAARSYANNHVAMNSVQSSLVGDAAPQRQERTYPFDNVFGPEADQGMVYQAAVAPVLNEVMNGYNCTVFAYGQTGTGKTHTMEGDLTSSVGTYSPEAGIIPRTLYRLFHTLELMRSEYSVHASFVELYNEELRDLLSDEPPQPLGGSGSSGLRMFEDSKARGGVIIQGLEDVPMQDAEHGLKLLRKGSQKRQIAATRCNESSSRSHSVFTLTVYIKDTTSKGEDVLRTGKLNLVDLAGSENIGRSGAENKRAREAGMINQSLLTLGRVINALVEKTAHVPYRESKLTRLLQDSLGGRTKTCIIATVSPDRSDYEETLSTLDYALRAKSIRNKPEVNQRMTRAALIKEYVAEIERLKGDLLASREKNGIYLSPESWTAMQDESEAAQAQIDDLQRQGQVTESKMISLREQFEQNMQMLIKREHEANAVRAQCQGKEDELKRAIEQAGELRQAAAEERALREAYMRSERKLHRIASSMRGVVVESTKDVSGLFAKLDRKSKVEKENRDIVAECQASLMSMSNQLEARVTDFGSSHEQFTLDLSAQISEFRSREQEKLRCNRESVEQKLQELQTLAKSMDKDAITKRDAIDVLADAIRREGDILVQASSKRNDDLRIASTQLVDAVVHGNQDSLGAVRRGIEELSEALSSALRDFKDQVMRDKEALESAKSLVDETLHCEINRLQEQNGRLSAALFKEHEKSAELRNQLCKNISQLVVSFCQEREDNTSAILKEMTHSNTQAHKSVQKSRDAHGKHINKLLDANAAMRELLEEKEMTSRAQRSRAEASLSQSTTGVERQMHDFSGRYLSSDREGFELVGATLHNISSNVDKMRENGVYSRQASNKNFIEYRTGAEKCLSEVVTELQSTLEDIDETCEGVVDGVNEQGGIGECFARDTIKELGVLRDTARDYLSSRVQVDLATGMTPHKREWPPVDTWNLGQGLSEVVEADSVPYPLPSGDNSISFVDGDLQDQLPLHDDAQVHEQSLGNLGVGGAQRGRTSQAAMLSYNRTSLPAVRHAMAKNALPKKPLAERAQNRMSMAAAPFSSKATNGHVVRARIPGSATRSTSVSKRTRQLP